MEGQLTSLQKLIDTLIEFSVSYSFQVLGALIVLVIGFVIGRWVSELVLKICQGRKLDITLSKFIAGVVKISILAFATIIALGKFGITIAPFVAAIGAAIFGATYALQGPLSNYGAGLTIILGRPFVVGDTVTVNDVSGIVEEVKLACTTLLTEDGVRITIPNKKIVGEILYNSKSNRVVDGVVGVSYDNDPEAAINLVKKTVGRFSEVVTNPPAQIGIKEFGDSSINIGYRYWVPTTKFYQLSGAINLAIFKAFQEAEINIPFPQRDVHVISQTPNPQSMGTSIGGRES